MTYKNRTDFSVRKVLLKKIARAIREAKAKKDFNLILIHGAGSFGHQLAHKHKLQNGVEGDPRKMRGSLLTSMANQKLNIIVSEIFLSEGVLVESVHTGSAIVQKNKRIYNFNLEIVKQSLGNNCIPVLYGEMVLDEELGMSICSGDTIAPYLAEKLKAQQMFFASDIDGIFDNDPYHNKKAKLIEEIGISEAKAGKGVNISNSHNVDVTGGLLGKIRSLEFGEKPSLKSVEIFNGLKVENYKKILLGNDFLHSKILL